MKVFVDTDIVLDACLPERKGKALAEKILALEDVEHTRIYISSLTMADAAYFLRQHEGKARALEVLTQLFRRHHVLPVNDMCVYHALRSECPDFEDAMQITCADYGSCDCIVTANARHLRGYAPMPVFTPEEFLAGLRAANEAAAASVKS